MNIKILKDKNFSLLMFGKITSLIGSSMQSFALSLFVLATTGSATKFASILAIAMIPELVLGPFAGVFVDWFYRKKILIILDIMSGIAVSVFTFIYFISGEMSIGYIYALVIILSLISTLFQPALQTIIPSIIKKEDLVEANSMNSLIMGIGNLIAPAIAGVLYGSLGLKIVCILNAITFFVSAISECFLIIPRNNYDKKELNLKVFWSDFSNGIKFSFGNKKITSIVTLAMILNFGLGSLIIGTTFLCKKVLMVSDFQYGLIDSVMVAAMMIASVISGYLGKKYSVGKNLYISLLFTGIVASCIGIVAFNPLLGLFNTSFIPYLILLAFSAVIGLFLGIANIFVGIYFQTVVPLEYMGRVSTVQGTIAMAAMPLSNMIFGILFDKVNPTLIFVISGIIVIIPVLLYKKILLSVDIEDENNEVALEN